MEPPIQVDSGVNGTQAAGPLEPQAIDATPPTHGLPITHVFEGLAATRSRSLGGEVAASLIAGSFTQLAHDLDITRKDLRMRDEQLRKANDELGSSKAKIAVLTERLGNTGRTQQLKQLSIFLGTALMSVAVDLYKNNLDKISYLLGLAGAILLLTGWLTNRAGVDE
jgi:hypothetical protein